MNRTKKESVSGGNTRAVPKTAVDPCVRGGDHG